MWPRKQLAVEVIRRSQARNQLRARRNDATRAEARIRELCRAQESRNHELQLQIRGIDHQLQTMAERIRDEFQLDVQDAVAKVGLPLRYGWNGRQAATTTATVNRKLLRKPLVPAEIAPSVQFRCSTMPLSGSGRQQRVFRDSHRD